MSVPSLQGKVVVITGATVGFGTEAAQAFCDAGASLVLAARRDDLPPALARDCDASDGRVILVPTSISRRADVQRLARRAVDAFGRIDVWVNSAGVGALGAFADVPLADHVQVIDSALIATLYGSYYALQQFLRQESGTVINIVPVLGRQAAAFYASGTAAEHGIIGLSAALRQELRETGASGVHICTVLPAPSEPAATTARDTVEIILRLAAAPVDEVVAGATVLDQVSVLDTPVAGGVWSELVPPPHGRRSGQDLDRSGPPGPGAPEATDVNHDRSPEPARAPAHEASFEGLRDATPTPAGGGDVHGPRALRPA
ncbi:MAG TPA: SDR family NAD(P)-dependent oxidoreductase [Gemmatimonadaceae bacterium]|nr:SDR family NAD(P)-dependent oxidoreductase [Gemmatimonadaceae bacterium]